MKLNIDDIPVGGRDLHFEVEPERFAARLSEGNDRSIHCSKPAQGHLNLSVNGQTVIVTGQGTGEFLTTCARCTEPTTVSLSVPLKMILKPHRERRDDEIEDVELSYYEGRELDLGPIVEEGLLLALPFVVYCRPDCRGLCPKCGVNLNKEQCSCANEGAGDERFQILKGLKVGES